MEKLCFSSPWSEDALAAELSNPDAYFVAAEEDGVFLGYAGMHCPWGEEKRLFRDAPGALPGALLVNAHEHKGNGVHHQRRHGDDDQDGGLHLHSSFLYQGVFRELSVGAACRHGGAPACQM